MFSHEKDQYKTHMHVCDTETKMIFICTVDEHEPFLRRILIEKGRACIDHRWRSKGREHVGLAPVLVPFFVAWDEAQQADSMDCPQRVLTTYPTSAFVRQARARLQALDWESGYKGDEAEAMQRSVDRGPWGSQEAPTTMRNAMYQGSLHFDIYRPLPLSRSPLALWLLR